MQSWRGVSVWIGCAMLYVWMMMHDAYVVWWWDAVAVRFN